MNEQDKKIRNRTAAKVAKPAKVRRKPRKQLAKLPRKFAKERSRTGYFRKLSQIFRSRYPKESTSFRYFRNFRSSNNFNSIFEPRSKS